MQDAREYLRSSIELADPEIVSCYDELPLWSAMFGTLLLRHVPLRRGMQVLDLGPGTGFPLLELAERLGASCRVHGLDPWDAGLRRAQRKARTRGTRNATLTRGDAVALPFADGRFDLIVSNLGVNNFADPERALRECRRVAKPTAMLALTTNLQGHMQELYEVYESILAGSGLPESVAALREHVRHRATVDGLAELLERTGFRPTAIREEKSSLRFLDGSALLRHFFIRLGFLDGWRKAAPPGQESGIFARLEARLNEVAQARGELALTIPMAYVEAERML